MIREQAIARCEELNRDEQDGRRWFVSQLDTEEWNVVAATVPGLPPRGSLHETVETRPVPDAPDPRTSLIRNIPPYGPA
ncbi:MAG: hypothetical protein M3071_14800 [Actinomycetota bacterium]|nr:hypothetical protein [Actinomycetota bacterium]